MFKEFLLENPINFPDYNQTNYKNLWQAEYSTYFHAKKDNKLVKLSDEF
jgi:hypothetical protein